MPECGSATLSYQAPTGVRGGMAPPAKFATTARGHTVLLAIHSRDVSISPRQETCVIAEAKEGSGLPVIFLLVVNLAILLVSQIESG
jgi:hypothetical protein